MFKNIAKKGKEKRIEAMYFESYASMQHFPTHNLIPHAKFFLLLLLKMINNYVLIAKLTIAKVLCDTFYTQTI